MIKNIVTLLVIALLIFSCKKKDSTPETTTNTTTTGGTTTGGTAIVPAGLTVSTGGEYCSLQTSYSYVNYNGTVTLDSSAYANFYAGPTGSVQPTYIAGGNMFFNGTAVPFMSNSNSYYLNCNGLTNITGTITWSVSGSGTVTPFSQSFIPSYPKYTGGNLLPDTCIKANGITINVSGVSNNQSSVVVYLLGSSTAYKYFFGSNGSVTFTPADLANFTVNQPLTIMVSLGNFFSATHNGVKHGFANTINYQKYSYLK